MVDVIAEYKKERVALEKKYADLKAPLFAKRDFVIVGTIDFDETVFEGNVEGIISIIFRNNSKSTKNYVLNDYTLLFCYIQPLNLTSQQKTRAMKL